MEQLVKLGFAVLAPDLSGTGELGQVTDATAFLGVQVGRTIAGIRAAEIVRCLQFLKTRKDMNPDHAVVGKTVAEILKADRRIWDVRP